MLASVGYRFLLWLVGQGAWIFPAPGANPLLLVEEDLLLRYDGIAHVQPEILAARLDAPSSNVIMFDVRTSREFDVSHIAGSVHVDPEMKPEEFQKRFAHMIQERDVVFYCSVGLRSSAFAERIRSVAIGARTDHVCNLRGGLFRWHNERRPLVNSDGSTVQIDAFNAYWSRFLRLKQCEVIS
jgi:rhodanese-related sulfurtransferase